MTRQRHIATTLIVFIFAWWSVGRADGPAMQSATPHDGGPDVLQALRTSTIESVPGAVMCMAISPDGRRLAAGSWTMPQNGQHDGVAALSVWDMSSGKFVANLIQGAGESIGRSSKTDSMRAMVSVIAFSPDSSKLAASDRAGITLYDIASGKPLWVAQHAHAATLGEDGSLAFSPQGKILASSGLGVTLTDVLTGNEPPKLDDRLVSCVAFSADGHWLAVGYQDNRIRLWNLATRRQAAEVHGQMGIIRFVAFSPDGTKLAAAGEGPVKLWRVVAQNGSMTLEKPAVLGDGMNSGFQFSSDSKLLAVGGLAVQLWSTETSKLLVTLPIAGSVAFSPDGKLLAVSGAGPQKSRSSISLLKMAAVLDPVAQAAVGNAAAAGLVNALRSDPAGPRALEALAQLNPTSRGAVPGLIETMKDPSVEVRCSMAMGLARVGPEAKAATPALVEAMHDDAPEVVEAAARALQTIDPEALAQTLPAIKAKMQQPPAWHHGTAGDLYQGRSLPRWIDLLGQSHIPNEIYGPSDAIRPKAAIRAAGPAAVPVLIKALADPRWYDRVAAAEALGWFATDAKPAIPSLTPLFNDETGQVRSQAADTLAKISRALERIEKK
jgi:HEAT repeat protein